MIKPSEAYSRVAQLLCINSDMGYHDDELQEAVDYVVAALEQAALLEDKPSLARGLAAITKERRRQDEKHGHHNHGLSRSKWLAIIMEELGETAKADLEDDELAYRIELIETAASCLNAWEHRVNGD